MDRYCPECNSTMTPSLVGYLCPDCGHMQRFYTMTGTELKSTSVPTPIASGGDADTTSSEVNSGDKIKTKQTISSPEAPEKNGVRGTLKRLMVPELSPPHDHVMESLKPPVTDQTATVKTSIDNNNEYDELLGMPMDADKSESAATPAADSTQEPTSKPKKKRHIGNWLLSGVIIFLIVIAILYYIIQR